MAIEAEEQVSTSVSEDMEQSNTTSVATVGSEHIVESGVDRTDSEDDQIPNLSKMGRFINGKIRERRYGRRGGSVALAGVLELVINTGEAIEKFYLEWKGDRIELLEKPIAGVDCRLSTTEESLQRIAAGHLNPQIAICAGKVKLEGEGDNFMELGMYAFNLFVQNG